VSKVIYTTLGINNAKLKNKKKKEEDKGRETFLLPRSLRGEQRAFLGGC